MCKLKCVSWSRYWRVQGDSWDMCPWSVHQSDRQLPLRVSYGLQLQQHPAGLWRYTHAHITQTYVHSPPSGSVSTQTLFYQLTIMSLMTDCTTCCLSFLAQILFQISMSVTAGTTCVNAMPTATTSPAVSAASALLASSCPPVERVWVSPLLTTST